jgi:hypothetical protein
MASLELLRKNNSPSITPWMDAMIYYTCLGNCIYDGILNSCSITFDISTNKATIETGMGQVLGYQFRNTSVSFAAIDSSIVTAGNTFTVGLKLYVDPTDEANDTLFFSFRDGSNTIQSSNEILINGSSTSGVGTYIPLWVVIISSDKTTATCHYINLAKPGIAQKSMNLLKSGKVNGKDFLNIFNDFWNLKEITVDYLGSTISSGVMSQPGARKAEKAGVATLCTHIGGNYTENEVDANLQVGGKGYMNMILPLFSNQSLDLGVTTSQSIDLDNELPSNCVSVVFIGASGMELLRTTPKTSSNGSKVSLDSYNGQTDTVSVTLGTSKFVFKVGNDPKRLFGSSEFTKISAYAIYTMKAIYS